MEFSILATWSWSWGLFVFPGAGDFLFSFVLLKPGSGAFLFSFVLLKPVRLQILLAKVKNASGQDLYIIKCEPGTIHCTKAANIFFFFFKAANISNI